MARPGQQADHGLYGAPGRPGPGRLLTARVAGPSAGAEDPGLDAVDASRPLPFPGGNLAARGYADAHMELHDTRTRRLTRVAPGHTVRVYVCGITPYDSTHLGHAFVY